MRHLIASIVVFVVMLSFARCGWAADEPKPSDKPAPATPAPAPGAQPGQPGQPGEPGQPGQPGQPGGGRGFRGGGFGGGFGGPGGGFGGPGMMRGMVARDPIDELIAVLGELNLSPDFTLTADQKTKVQSVRDDFKKQTDEWRKAHADEIKKLQDEAAELRGGGGGGFGGGGGPGGANREKMQEIFQARQQLMESAPKSDEAIAEIKGILTTDQLKKLDAAVAAKQAEMEKMREEMRGRFGPGGGGGGGRGGPGRGGAGGRGGQGGGGGGGGEGGGGGAGRGPRGI